jgi:hypothetical protein
MPRLRRNFPQVEPTTERWFYLDFGPDLGIGETIQIAAVSLTTARGSDPNAAALIKSLPAINGTLVGAFCGPGWIGGVAYSFSATASTSAGNILPNNTRIYCQGPAPTDR